MKKLAKRFAVAVIVTILDISTVRYYGPSIWLAWSGIPWIEFVLLVLASIGSFTLSDIWARSFAKEPFLGQGDRSRSGALQYGEITEAADV